MGSPKKSQKETQQKLPQWFEDASQWNIDQGRELAGREYTAYDYQRQADFNPLQTDAFNSANFYGSMAPGAFEGAYGMLNDTSGQGMMGNAYSQMQGLFGQEGLGQMPGYQGSDAYTSEAALGDRGNIQNVEGGSFLGMDRDAYTNQYTQGVSDNVLSDITRQSDQQANQIGANAAAAGAFGGSRHGVQEAVNMSEANRNYGQMSNQLNAQAFDAASGLMGQDLTRGLQASGMNQNMDAMMESLNANLGTQNNQFNAGQQQQNSQYNAGNQMTSDYYNMQGGLQAFGDRAGLLNQMSNTGYNMGNMNLAQGQALENFGQGGMNAQLGAGDRVQQQNQQQLSSMYQDFLEARDWTANNFQYANAGMPNQVGGTTTEDVFSPNNLQQGISAGIGLAGAASKGASKSHSSYKTIHCKTDVDAIAAKVINMELYDWDYDFPHAPDADDKTRMGPMAEDFNGCFEDPDKMEIDHQRHISSLHATIQSLARRIEDLENR